MPNWCENVVIIEHEDRRMIERLEKACSEGKLLETLRPMPSGEWNYDWCVSNWGTKWDVEVHTFNTSPNGLSLELMFDSAWSPPIEAYAYAETESDYKIQAYYIEGGIGFIGAYEDGQSYDYDYPSSLKHYKKLVENVYPKDLVENLNLDEHFEIVFEEWEE